MHKVRNSIAKGMGLELVTVDGLLYISVNVKK